MKIQGIIAPLITPMHPDESVNLTELRGQVNRLISAGVHGIFPFGTNGEGYILDESEKEAILEAVVDEVNGRVPVYAGTGCISTRDTIRLSRRAMAIGANALSVITPSFAQASQDELYAHYAALADAVALPIVLYNIPARTGNALAPATVGRLSQLDGICGAKDSSGNFDNMLQYIEKTRERDFAILSGNDSLILWGLMAGGTGAVSGCANVFPENMVAIYNAFVAGDMARAKSCQDAIRPFRDCFRHGNPNTIVKAAVALQGYEVGSCRSPFNKLSPACIEELGAVLVQLDAAGVR